MNSATGRGFYQHCAIRDSGAKDTTTRRLGISSSHDVQNLPLHKIRSAMRAAHNAIPTTSTGIPLLSGYLDPYLACLIAPDHLISGHFRDCVNAAFRLLPSKTHRKASENYMMGLLAECNLPKQNRLFDHEKKSLLSMSMTELYALSVVAHRAFIRACASDSSNSSTITPRSRQSIRVVASCSALISKLWDRPTINRNNQLSSSYLDSIQKQTVMHITMVQDLCSMQDADWQLLQRSGSASRRRALKKDYRDCLAAIKAVDKPNVHRLYELVYTTLPMVGFVSRVGELVLEKAHQILKRAISQSNNREVQLQSMQSAAFSDWQGRLTIQVAGAFACKTNAIRGCFRLLAGREAIAMLEGRVGNYHYDLLREALGPICCVPELLRAQAKSVLSPRANTSNHMTWVLEKNVESPQDSSPLSTETRSQSYNAFKIVCSITGSIASITFGDAVRCFNEDGALNFGLKLGDVLQVQCFNFRNWSAQFPVVSQFSSMMFTDQLSAPLGPLYWKTVAFFTKRSRNGVYEYWAAVYPCTPVPHVYTRDECDFPWKRYVLSKKVSFLVLDKSVIPVAAIPACPDRPCPSSPSTDKISHCSPCDPFRGSPFFLLTKAEGYPPRKG